MRIGLTKSHYSNCLCVSRLIVSCRKVDYFIVGHLCLAIDVCLCICVYVGMFALPVLLKLFRFIFRQNCCCSSLCKDYVRYIIYTSSFFSVLLFFFFFFHQRLFYCPCFLNMYLHLRFSSLFTIYLLFLPLFYRRYSCSRLSLSHPLSLPLSLSPSLLLSWTNLFFISPLKKTQLLLLSHPFQLTLLPFIILSSILPFSSLW